MKRNDWRVRATPTTLRVMQIGPYTLGRELGRGAMGVVYEAHEPLLDRRVAVKVVTASTPLDLSQVRREAKAAARLRHPHVVGLHAAGREDGRVWLAMDLVPGRTLKALINDEGPLPPRRAAQMAMQLADALHYAHGQGVLHRDMKPENVLISEEGSPFLADFGLSKLLDPTSTQLTETGDMIGTPAYAAPEQLRGDHREVGPATDVYGLGGILYCMLAGASPFADALDDKLTLIQAVLHQPPAFPRPTRDRIPPALRRICLRCLAKEPSARYHSAADLVADLRAFLDGAPQLRRSRSPWVAVAALAVGGLLGMATTLGLGLRLEDALSPELDRLYDRGTNRVGRGDFEGALEDFLPVVAERPDESWVWYRVGAARSELDDHTGALEAFDHALAGDTSDFDDDDLATIYVHRATTLWELERDAEGLQSVERAIALHPLSGDAWHVRSLLRSRLESSGAAVSDSDRALELDPRNHIARFQRAQHMADAEPRPSDAELIAELRQIVEVAPDFWLAPYNLGLLLQAQGDLAAAQDAYRRAILAQLESPKPLFSSGALHTETTDWIDAYGDFTLAQELEPTNHEHYWRRGLVLQRLGALGEAVKDVERAISMLAPGDKDYQALVDWRGQLQLELARQTR